MIFDYGCEVLGCIGSDPARYSTGAMMLRAGALSIEPLEGSRPRLRQTRACYGN